jgi:hypothetical protein
LYFDTKITATIAGAFEFVETSKDADISMALIRPVDS